MDSSPKIANCSNCRFHSKVEQLQPTATAETGFDDVIEVTEESAISFMCHAVNKNEPRAVGLIPVEDCDMWAKPTITSALADDLMAKYEARINKKS